MPYPYEDNDEEYNEPFDYDYYGPNSDFHHGGYGGHGFDDIPEGLPPFHVPEEPEQKLHDWKRDDPNGYDKIMQVLVRVCLKKNIRLLKKFGESPGAEKLMQALEADIDAGNCKLMNAPVHGTMCTCVYDFDPCTGGYLFSQDN